MQKEKIVVIGAGASGLTCARTLARKGFDVTVLEAEPIIGGRCIPQKGFLSWKDLDLGGEFIHGDNTILMDLVREHGLPCRLMFTWAQGDGETPKHAVNGGMSMYYLAKEKKLLRYDTNDEKVKKVNELLWSIGEHENTKDRATMEEFMKKHGIDETGLSLAEAGYTNTLCSNNKYCAWGPVIELEKSWESNGDGDFRLENGLFQVPQILATGLDVRTNFVVKSVNYQGNQVEITSAKGEKVHATRVVVSASLGVLKAGNIQFSPPLPRPKLDAINLIRFENAIKIVLKMRKQFWPKELHGIICGDAIIPEFWFDAPDRVGALTPESSPHLSKKRNPNEEDTYLVSAFACSKKAEYILSLPKHEAIGKILSLLDEMFGNKYPNELLRDERIPQTEPYHHTRGEQNGPMPATSAFMEFLIQSWKDRPNALGGYSSPTVGETSATRDALRENVGGKVFFCGEHTNRSYMTINAAMDSGVMAADDILKFTGTPAPSSKL